MKGAVYVRKLEVDITWLQKELNEIKNNPVYQRRVRALRSKLHGLRQARSEVLKKIPALT